MEWVDHLLNAENVAIAALAGTNGLTAFLLIRAFRALEQVAVSIEKMTEALTHVRIAVEVVKEKV